MWRLSGCDIQYYIFIENLGNSFRGCLFFSKCDINKREERMNFPALGTWFFSQKCANSWASWLELLNSMSNSIVISNKTAIYLEIMLLHRCVAAGKTIYHSAQQCAYVHLVWVGLWLYAVVLPNKLFSKC